MQHSPLAGLVVQLARYVELVIGGLANFPSGNRRANSYITTLLLRLRGGTGRQATLEAWSGERGERGLPGPREISPETSTWASFACMLADSGIACGGDKKCDDGLHTEPHFLEQVATVQGKYLRPTRLQRTLGFMSSEVACYPRRGIPSVQTNTKTKLDRDTIYPTFEQQSTHTGSAHKNS